MQSDLPVIRVARSSFFRNYTEKTHILNCRLCLRYIGLYLAAWRGPLLNEILVSAKSNCTATAPSSISAGMAARCPTWTAATARSKGRQGSAFPTKHRLRGRKVESPLVIGSCGNGLMKVCYAHPSTPHYEETDYPVPLRHTYDRFVAVCRQR